ncbi:MAG: hypothetical protein MR009_00385 [Sutterellaceae bacterium]|nr:hypothetical protein [Sutterellaceae bacterium]MDD7441634.1 hypothetical protein [Sutterellaceae bacterium]MDY2867982.1 hypothetical protein [Mesosutterella sp.]
MAEQGKTCCALRKPGDPVFPIPSAPGYPKLRAGTQLDAIYERFLAKGRGFGRPGCPGGLPRVVVAFDLQCPWCHRFWETAKVLEREIDFRWYPVCVTKDVSTAQAAAVLAAADPYALASESEDLFNDPDFRGIDPKEHPVTQEERDTAWENSRIFRKSGGTSVPLGIYRTPDGRYIPLFGDMTAEEIRKAIGLGKAA